MKSIALFNHKGGVSKTTTAFHLGWMLAQKGHKVVLVDADPQCNLTGMMLGYKGPSELNNFYRKHPERNLRAALAPAFESRPKPIEAVECIALTARPGLFLLPGHIRLAEYEVQLGIAQELSGSIQALQNLPGAMSFLFHETARKYRAEFILIDMSPSLSSINQNLLMTSDAFIVPTSPDIFSVMAIDSLTSVLPNWKKWAEKAHALPVLEQATYPFPAPRPMFLGTIIQKYRPRAGAPTTGFQEWITSINASVEKKLKPTLKDNDMLLPSPAYRKAGIGSNLCLATIPDFNTLIAKSQRERTPIFALTDAQFGQQGVVLRKTLEVRDKFQSIFSSLSDKVSELLANVSVSN